MTPNLEVYFDPSRLPPPAVLAWLAEEGLAAVHRTPAEAPEAWLARYGCCFPWVVADGRIVLKAGFQRSHLDRLIRKWRGAPLFAWLRTPERMRTVSAISNSADNSSIQEDLQREDILPEWNVWPLQTSFDIEAKVLASFRTGQRPVIIWMLAEVVPDPAAAARACELTQHDDVVLGYNAPHQFCLFGLKSWHGGLLSQATGENGWQPEQIKWRASQLGLTVADFAFA